MVGSAPERGRHGRAHANPPRCRSRHPQRGGRSQQRPRAPDRRRRSCGRGATARQPAIYGIAGAHMELASRCTCTPLSDVHSPIGNDPRRSPGQAGVLEHVVKREAPPREHVLGIGSPVAEDPADLPPLQHVLGGEPLARAGPGRTNAPASDRSGKTGEDDPFGPASRPTKGLERLLASLEMGDHRSSVPGPCPGPGDQKTGSEPDAGGGWRRS